MERKLIKQGGGGYTIYLPKTWVEGKGLKQGNIVSLSEKNNSLIINADSVTKSETSIDMNGKTLFDLRVLLTHAYRRGISLIKVENIDEKGQKELKEIVSKLLLGFEITQKEGKSITIENISEPTDQKFDIIMKRILLISDESIKFIIEEVEKKSFKNMNEMNEIRANHDRFLLFCRRLISKEKIDGNPVLLWEFLTFIQHIEHNLYYLYEYLYENKPKIQKDTLKLINELKIYFELLSKAYLENDLDIINEINNKRNKYHFGELIKLIEKSKGSETIVLSYLREIFRLIQVGTSPVLSIILDKSNK